MSAQPLLFDIPKDQRAVSDESRMTAFENTHGIWTQRSSSNDAEPWIAFAWKEVAERLERKCDGSEQSIWDLFGATCSWADDAGLLVSSKGRLTALRKLAERLELPDPLEGGES